MPRLAMPAALLLLLVTFASAEDVRASGKPAGGAAGSAAPKTAPGKPSKGGPLVSTEVFTRTYNIFRDVAAACVEEIARFDLARRPLIDEPRKLIKENLSKVKVQIPGWAYEHLATAYIARIQAQAAASEWITFAHARLDAQAADIVGMFEKKYPQHKGLIGKNFLDFILLVTYLVLVSYAVLWVALTALGFALIIPRCLVCGICGCRFCRSGKKAATLTKEAQHATKKGSKPSSNPSQTAPSNKAPSKPPTNKK